MFLHQQILLFIFWNNWVSDTSLYGFINHFGKLDVMLLYFQENFFIQQKWDHIWLDLLALTGTQQHWFEFSLQNQFSLPLFLHSKIATWSFDNRYISAGKHLIHKMFTLYTVFPLWSWWLAWKALNYVTYWIFLSGLDARGVPVITFQIDYNLRNIP